MTKKPTVKVNCTASKYALPNERIVEFYHGETSGLIQLYTDSEGFLRVNLYRLDEKVKVSVYHNKTTKGN